MATSNTRRQRPLRTIVTFGIVTLALFAAIFVGTKVEGSGASFAPGLALDLEGGTQIILRPITSEGEVTPETITQAISVIRQRVDSSGVSEAEITSQGKGNIVVGLPGTPSQETIDLVRKSAQMRFRPVLAVASPIPTATPDAETDGATADDPVADDATADGADAPTDGSTASPTDGATDGTDAAADDPAADEPTTPPANPSDLSQITPAIQKQADQLDCTNPASLAGGGGDAADKPLVTCADNGSVKYILGPVEIEGTEISSASSGLRSTQSGVTTNEWVVNIEFNGEGTKLFRDTTTRLTSLPAPTNAFAMVLDGLVVSAPTSNVAIPDGKAEISGSFTRETAATLANQLNFGALPLTFEVQSQEQISATLGSEQLEKGLIAGLIGLLLVVVYSMFQYRMLGLLTVASLVVAAAVTYVIIALLSWGIGYRLSLPGVAGLIVAIGFTADSFIVYFERIRDELRDGRTLHQAVQKGWARARRTILAAKAVNLIAAVILYFLAVGGVQGFAFTLGLTTIVDVAVVFWFTHPVMELLAKVPYFRDGHRFSGLSPDRLQASGTRYVGAGRVVTEAPAKELVSASSVATPSAPRSPALSDDGRRLTIAERRAAERRSATEVDGSGTSDNSTHDSTTSDTSATAQDGTNEENR